MHPSCPRILLFTPLVCTIAALVAGGCAPAGGTRAAAIADTSTVALPATSARPDSTGPRILPARAADILAAVHAPGARATFVNVWATWCGPCREEFPALVRFQRAWRDRGVRVIFVSADFDDQLPAVRAFLEKQGVTEPTWIKTGDDMQFINVLNKKWSGALPATFVFDASGTPVQFWEGAADSARFASAAVAALARTHPNS